jgi:ClpP class serine protease
MPIASIFRSLFARTNAPDTPLVWSAPAPEPAHDHGHPGGPAGAPGGGPWQSVIARLQQRRNSHVIGLVHRHQHPAEHPYEWYFDAVIGETHAEDFLSALGQVPPGERLDIVLHSVGAFSPPVQQIARAIKAYKGQTTVFVPYYAHSLSTLIATAADNIVMGSSASLSFVEFSDLDAVARAKGIKRTQDYTLMRAGLQRMFSRELKELVCELTHGGAHGENCPLARDLIGTKRAAVNPITPALAKSIGLNVSTQTPDEVFALIRACRATPVRDHGVKTAARVFASVHAAQPAAQQFAADPALMPDVARGLSAGLELGAPAVRRPAPEPRAGGDDDDDGMGVALENCDIMVRPLIAKLEASRGSRVICVIHQMDMESHHVDTATKEDILSALQLTPPGMALDVILHTPGGLSFHSKQIAHALKAHKGKKTVFVPYFAMSGGTIIALAADEIAMAPHAVLGPIDTQWPVQSLYSYFPSRAIVKLAETKPKHRIHDELLDLANRCRRTIAQDHQDALALMQGAYSTSVANRIAHRLNDGDLTHGYPITAGAAAKLGLNVTVAIPPEVTQIVRAFRRNRDGKRSVIYCV